MKNIDACSLEELQIGYQENHDLDTYECIFCDSVFEKGVIYPIIQRLYDAKKAMEHHITAEHRSVFEALIQLSKRDTGLSDIQSEMLQFFYQGLSDKEIVQLSNTSASTIRQHRFKLKEKERQAKVFLALMANVQEGKFQKDFIPIHKGATMVDERYAITEEEKTKVLETYFNQGVDKEISVFPSKEKRKIVVLQQILTRFEKGRNYTEKEVNEILKKVYSDHVTIRRYLIEYGFMDRSQDCSTYWVKGDY